MDHPKPPELSSPDISSIHESLTRWQVRSVHYTGHLNRALVTMLRSTVPYVTGMDMYGVSDSGIAFWSDPWPEGQPIPEDILGAYASVPPRDHEIAWIQQHLVLFEGIPLIVHDRPEHLRGLTLYEEGSGEASVWIQDHAWQGHDPARACLELVRLKHERWRERHFPSELALGRGHIGAQTMDDRGKPGDLLSYLILIGEATLPSLPAWCSMNDTSRRGDSILQILLLDPEHPDLNCPEDPDLT